VIYDPNDKGVYDRNGKKMWGAATGVLFAKYAGAYAHKVPMKYGDNFAAVVEAIKKYVNDVMDGELIGKLRVFDHGSSSSGQEFGDVTLEDLLDSKDGIRLLTELGKLIKPGGHLYLYGCGVGKATDLLRRLHNLMPHVIIHAPTGDCWYTGIRDPWVTFDFVFNAESR
jgi:hypothetical protein